MNATWWQQRLDDASDEARAAVERGSADAAYWYARDAAHAAGRIE